jgi:dTDP-4-dehydrorhamnose 3,5-epimerase
MKFTPSHLTGIVTIEPDLHEDARGSFRETWHLGKFRDAGIDVTFAQENYSVSRRWVLRGLHYQVRHAQGKLIRVTHGEVFDVAVDLRRSSPQFGQWIGEHLSAENRRMLWIPPGFAHGFLVLSERADFVYSCTDFYDRDGERALLWSDPGMGIAWPIPSGVKPILSPKDMEAPTLDRAESFP